MYTDAFVVLLEREQGYRPLLEHHPDRPLYGWMLRGTVALFGSHRGFWIAISLAAWALLAWQCSRIWKRLFPQSETESWIPALLLLSPIVVQTQFQTLTIAYPCVVPVCLGLAALLLGLRPEPGHAVTWAGVALLAFVAALVSEYGVAAAIAGGTLAMVLRRRREAALLTAGAGLGALVFRLTSNFTVRPGVSAEVELPRVISSPLGVVIHWLSGLWYSTIGAWAAAAARMNVSPQSRGPYLAVAAGLVTAALVFLATRRDDAAAASAIDLRRTAALMAGVGAGTLPVVLAGRSVSPAGFVYSSFDTRFLIPALPFVCVLVAGVLIRGSAPRLVPAVIALLGFLCAEEAWRGAFAARRSQRWAEDLGRALRPLVKDSPGITLAVIESNPTRRWWPTQTSRATLDWTVDEERRVWVLRDNQAARMLGPRDACHASDTIRISTQVRSVPRIGPLSHVVWVPSVGDAVGTPEPYCTGPERPSSTR